MNEPRYINRGNFGVRGVNRVTLHETVSAGVFVADYREKGTRIHTWRAKIWYRVLRAKEIRARKPNTMRHTFISVGLTNGVKIKWLASTAEPA